MSKSIKRVCSHILRLQICSDLHNCITNHDVNEIALWWVFVEIAIDVSAKGQQSEKLIKGFWNGEKLHTHVKCLQIFTFKRLRVKGTVVHSANEIT